jgi:hypothetical protein
MDRKSDRIIRVADLRLLSKAYVAETGIAETTLSERISPTNNRLIYNLVRGKDLRGKYVELASDWFDENWPAGVRRLLDKPRRERSAAE